MTNNKICIMPMVGSGSRFLKKGYITPKPLIKVNKIPMFLRASKSFNKNNKWIFLLKKNNHERQFTQLIKKNFKRFKIIILDKKTDGQARTVFKAKKNITNESNIFVSSCDLYIKYNNDKLDCKLKNNDFVVFVHKPNTFNIKKSSDFGWIKIKNNKIIKSACKSTVSSNPKNDWIILGSFVFKNKKIFNKILRELFTSKIKVKNEYYLDTCIEVALKLNLKVTFMKIDKYISWGTPVELKNNYYK